MWKDAAVEEIREARQLISQQFGHDTKALLDHYRQLEHNYQARLLREPAAEGIAAPTSEAPDSRPF